MRTFAYLAQRDPTNPAAFLLTTDPAGARVCGNLPTLADVVLVARGHARGLATALGANEWAHSIAGMVELATTPAHTCKAAHRVHSFCSTCGATL